MIKIYSGIPGSGKSLKLASESLRLLERNLRYYSSTGIVRKIYSNMRFSSDVEKKYKEFIGYWNSTLQLVNLKDCDVIWDEVATDLDSTRWADTPLELKRWLQQHRKRGIDIYGTTQDFAMIDIAMKRLVSDLYVLYKIIGSRDKSATRPPPSRVWGLILVREVAPSSFRKRDGEDYKFIYSDWFLITSALCSAYDTQQEIVQGEFPPLRHVERKCLTCGHIKVSHV